ncbi:MAG TPA: phage tail sheath subtilisin-like domain-containing protein [Stellaceae bacterium]|jgi:phage tail sheath protein FI|nr:phage tail sheath subtilisin-like domain-containing protein [Stellaceae bacterium]
MPEYLSPGVYIEELPSGLKAIEGVSTSTAAFVGPASRGTVPGYVWPGSGTPNLPFTPAGGFVMVADPSPVLVTSFSEFQRNFGALLPIAPPGDPTDYGYLGYSVRAFFDNGGKRAYIARIVGDAAAAGTVTVAQGVVYRLLRSAAINDTTVYLTSTRGLNVGDQITFTRHSDGGPALGTPAQPGAVVGAAVIAPFALEDQDQLTITPTPGAPLTVTIVAKPVVLTIAAPAGPPSPNFNLLDNDELQLRVGAATEPVQTVIFKAADPLTPITSGNATPAEVQACISRFVSGVRCYLNGNDVIIESDVRGTAAGLSVVGGDAAVKLGLTVGAGTQAGGSNLPDAGHASIADLQALIVSADITVGNDGAGHLRITSQPGVGNTVKLDEVTPGLLARLGFGSVATITSPPGTAGTSSALTITAYDPNANSISFAAGLSSALDGTDIYGIVVAGPQPPVPNTGPKFYARSPGAWSAGVTVQITNSDRQPVAVTGAAAVGATTVPVQNLGSFYIGGSIEIDHGGAGRSVHQIAAINQATRQLTINPALAAPALVAGAATARTLEIDITVNDTSGAAPTETYKGMAWAQGGGADVRRHYAWSVNAGSRLVWVQPPSAANEDFHLAHQPTTPDGFPVFPTGGVDGYPTSDDDWVGDDNGPGQRSGIESLQDLTDARIIAAPGKATATVQLALIAQCENLRYRFAILDGERDPAGGSLTSILSHRNLYDTSFAAYYQPWFSVVLDNQKRLLPPSGFLAGIYARVDNNRGVWKAPANEPVLNISGLKTEFTTGEQDLLNPDGVNLIRRFDVGGIRVWGARTLSSDPDVKYINVRRTLIFLEASIDQGTQWVVFEPNTPDTWTRLSDSVSAFLLTQWRAGALFGRKPEQAFFVRCDETTMTADDILNGRLICQIGVAIVRPAEFVIFQIQQITNFGAQT